jgi:hypothetical protein
MRMEEKKNVLDTLLDNLSGGTYQPGGNEDILDPKKHTILA